MAAQRRQEDTLQERFKALSRRVDSPADHTNGTANGGVPGANGAVAGAEGVEPMTMED